MKRYILSGLTLTLATLAIAPTAMASGGQTTLHDSAADLSGDGTVSIGELVRYNRAQRGS
ncbi:MAG: hypothetical protein EA342_05750 [Leptolyngbya sp. LCM1.Bin17]|nr:MAG: hypothetical protein EA342_05750 [Leptolyngbya sp. LCM1.Bin17]